MLVIAIELVGGGTTGITGVATGGVGVGTGSSVLEQDNAHPNTAMIKIKCFNCLISLCF